MPARFMINSKLLRDTYNKDTPEEMNREIKPTLNALIIDGNKNVRKGVFGWSRSWSEKPIINSRSENMKSNMFYEAYEERRCIVPATEFYEWKDGNKYKIFLPEEDLFSMAGLWEEDNGELRFLLLTRNADEKVGEIHERMPIIFTTSYEEKMWLEEGKIIDKDYNGKIEYAKITSGSNKDLLSF